MSSYPHLPQTMLQYPGPDIFSEPNYKTLAGYPQTTANHVATDPKLRMPSGAMRCDSTRKDLVEEYFNFLDANRARELYHAKVHEILGSSLRLLSYSWKKEAAVLNFWIHLISSVFQPLAEVVLTQVLAERNDPRQDCLVHPIHVEPAIPELTSGQSGDLDILLRSGKYIWSAFSMELKADSVMHSIAYPSRLRTIHAAPRFRLEDARRVKLDPTGTSSAAIALLTKGCLHADHASTQHSKKADPTNKQQEANPVNVVYFLAAGARLSMIGQLGARTVPPCYVIRYRK
ncbi:BZ3500_MvSof-1268-A1-R1_Chr5-3g08316 [Microbotryum saponariae]|uniref:BZ3500_MvSof-1268-A1-R1_Chr5-3g08316 protein n=1 Tax=Microbotryum saponariae TaxID=289078 RepID=A0A2X0LMN4_9BASI|nr:BZ3500_MvSof-1268-A1-R1_Chr5-3g08316 [Microbotryum saponariae]SDA08424.1 BZ3501_MvSof-1269-A2-R1_Chr5-3g08044 [Microbotryum saponariae]